ncbi:MAG: BspA family leucine-rich repeat surface protein, partial [Flavobacteriaceae bacterium]|nr:BspA family leucine-rich repeat surface protein [Flavobacteriaceae bacterium]
MKKLLLFVLIIVFSCSKDEPPSFLISINSQIGGTVSSSGGEYAQGKSITVTATPDVEYEFV